MGGPVIIIGVGSINDLLLHIGADPTTIIIMSDQKWEDPTEPTKYRPEKRLEDISAWLEEEKYCKPELQDINSLYIPFYESPPWRKGTKVIHRKYLLVEKPVPGFVRQVFHPPKIIRLRIASI